MTTFGNLGSSFPSPGLEEAFVPEDYIIWPQNPDCQHQTSPLSMPTNSPILPPIESLLIPEAVDFNFTHNADQPFFTYAKGDSDDVTVITHLEFGRAAHRVAHAVRPDRTGLDGQVVAVIALADVVLYQAVTAGLITANLVVSARDHVAAATRS